MAYRLNLPNSLQEELKVAAEADGVSINRFIMLAVAEKIAVLKQANRLEHYHSKPAVSRKAFLEVLAQAPDVEPTEEDKKRP